MTVFSGSKTKPVKPGSSIAISPVEITIPLSIPKLVLVASKKPICIGCPWNDWLDAEIPHPKSTLSIR